MASATENKVDLEGMESQEGDLDSELGFDEDGEEDGEDSIRIKADFSEIVAAQYRIEGKPDYFNFHTVHVDRLEDNHTTTTINDYYLEGFEAIPLFGASLKALDRRYDYPMVSAYSKETHKYTQFTQDHVPRHGMTEGGKGLTLYTHSVIYHTADMSSILNVTISHGCPSNAVALHSRNTVETSEGVVTFAQILSQGGGEIRVSPQDFEKVERVRTENFEMPVVEIVDLDGTRYITTEDHPFMTRMNGSIVPMPVRDIFGLGLPLLKHRSGDVGYRQVRVVSITPLPYPMQVGDIQIPTAQQTYLLNGALTHNCSFCKESLISRGFTQVDFREGSGVIQVTLESGESFEVSSKVRVKFFDTKQERIVIGPLSVAIVNVFPIATHSLQQLRDKELFRVLSD